MRPEARRWHLLRDQTATWGSVSSLLPVLTRALAMVQSLMPWLLVAGWVCCSQVLSPVACWWPFLSLQPFPAAGSAHPSPWLPVGITAPPHLDSSFPLSQRPAEHFPLMAGPVSDRGRSSGRTSGQQLQLLLVSPGGMVGLLCEVPLFIQRHLIRPGVC